MPFEQAYRHPLPSIARAPQTPNPPELTNTFWPLDGGAVAVGVGSGVGRAVVVGVGAAVVVAVGVGAAVVVAVGVGVGVGAAVVVAVGVGVGVLFGLATWLTDSASPNS